MTDAGGPADAADLATPGDGDGDASQSPSERIERLAARSRADAAAFEAPEEPPDEQRAMQFLREGVGPAISVYVEGRTGGRLEPFSAADLAALEGAMNRWLDLYAACYGVELDAAFTIREAAEMLVQTHNVRDVARLLTTVPAR